MSMSNKVRYAAKRTFYQIVYKEKAMTILGAVAGPFETRAEVEEAMNEYRATEFQGGYVIRKVTYELV